MTPPGGDDGQDRDGDVRGFWWQVPDESGTDSLWAQDESGDEA